jgi:ornithine decarboxylase
VLLQISGVFDLGTDNGQFYGDKLETAASQYEEAMFPPFFGEALCRAGNLTFACPGHQDALALTATCCSAKDFRTSPQM